MVVVRRDRMKVMMGIGFVVSLGVVSFFLLSEYVWGYEPCSLCEWQRYPWYGSVVLCFLGLVWERAGVMVLVALCVLCLLGGSLGFYHAGVEYGFWAGPSSCASGVPVGASVDSLRDYLLGRGTVPCDKASWTLWGVSMAGYNGLVSYGIVVFIVWWLYVRRRVWV